MVDKQPASRGRRPTHPGQSLGQNLGQNLGDDVDQNPSEKPSIASCMPNELPPFRLISSFPISSERPVSPHPILVYSKAMVSCYPPRLQNSFQRFCHPSSACRLHTRTTWITSSAILTRLTKTWEVLAYGTLSIVLARLTGNTHTTKQMALLP